MSRRPDRCRCDEIGDTCRHCDRLAENRAEARLDGEAATSSDMDVWEAGPGWHSYPGQAGW